MVCGWQYCVVITSGITRFVNISFSFRGEYSNVWFTGATVQREILHETGENIHEKFMEVMILVVRSVKDGVPD